VLDRNTGTIDKLDGLDIILIKTAMAHEVPLHGGKMVS
jgi:hypothetical protein